LASLIVISVGVALAFQSNPQLTPPTPGKTVLLAQANSQRKSGPPAPGAEKNSPYDNWLNEDVAYIITDEEKNAFLNTAADADRDQFISRFWEVRNPTPGAPSNPYKEEHYRRLEYATQYFGHEAHGEGWRTIRGRIYITLGEPKQKAVYQSLQNVRPMEIWFYSNAHPALPPFFYIVFYKREEVGDFQLYSPYFDGPEKLVNTMRGINDRAASLKIIDKSAGREVARGRVGEVDMEDQQLAARRAIPRRRVMHRMEDMQPLGVAVDQLGGEAQHVALFHLTLVGDVRLEHEERMVGAPAVFGAEPEPVEQRVGGAVEHQHVIGDVHVAVIVDPRRLDGSAVDI